MLNQRFYSNIVTTNMATSVPTKARVIDINIEISLLRRIYNERNHSHDPKEAAESPSNSVTIPFQFPVLKTIENESTTRYQSQTRVSLSYYIPIKE